MSFIKTCTKLQKRNLTQKNNETIKNEGLSITEPNTSL